MSFGSIAGMIVSLRNNSRRKVHAPFIKGKKYNTKKESLNDYDFPNATPEKLEKIKKDLKHYNRRQTIKALCITIMTLTAFIYVLFFM